MEWFSRNPFSPINEALLDIHEAMNIGEIISGLVARIPSLVPVASIAAFHVGDDGWQFTEVISPDLSPSLFVAYKDYYEPYDIYKQIVFARDPLPPVDRSSDYMDYPQWERNPHRSEFLVPNGMYHMAGMQIMIGSQLVADISLHRETGSPDFNADEMAILHLLQRHASLACRNSRLRTGTDSNGALTSALSTDRGVVIYDHRLSPIYRNAAAELACDYFIRHAGPGVPLIHLLADLIAQHVAGAVSSAIIDAPCCSGHLRLPDCSLAYSAIRNNTSGGTTQYIVYLEWRDSDGNPTHLPQLPFQVSQREYEIAKLLARGMSNATIATALSISTNTVKTHIKHLMSKTGSHTRAGIVYVLFGNRFRGIPADLDNTSGGE